MTRKRFVKLLMSRGYSRNEATRVALLAIRKGIKYGDAYFAVRINDGDSEVMEVIQEICNRIAEILRIPRILLFAATE